MEDSGEKLEQWTRFYQRAQALLRGGPRALRKLSAAELARLIDDYQALTADLARARSLGAARETVDQLNRIAVAGHNLLYGRIRLRDHSRTVIRAWRLRAGRAPACLGRGAVGNGFFRRRSGELRRGAALSVPGLRSARR